MISDYRYRPVAYFTATFTATYALWFAGAFVSFRDDRGLHMLIMLPGLMAPFVISLLMLLASKNEELRADFSSRLFDLKRIRPRFLPILFLIMPVTVLASIAISLPFGGSIAQFHLAEGFSFSPGFAPVLLVLFLAASFEELGWRGYAFDSLQSRFNYFWASITFSLLWSLWHIPLIFVKNSYQWEIARESHWFAVNFFVGIVPMGVIISWVCIKNKKSILAAILFHFIINISQESLAITQVTKCIETIVLTGVAALIVASDRALFFRSSGSPPQKN